MDYTFTLITVTIVIGISTSDSTNVNDINYKYSYDSIFPDYLYFSNHNIFNLYIKINDLIIYHNINIIG